jgi:prephenate dehydrogenase (NADP+)
MNIEIGVVGLGDMGLMYVRQFAIAGYRVNCCDLPSKFKEISDRIENCGFDTSNVHVHRDGFGVVRRSDFIVYSVEAAYISAVVSQFGPATKLNAIVSGQTSVKEPEIKAFDEFLPKDVAVVTCHSLHVRQGLVDGLNRVLKSRREIKHFVLFHIDVRKLSLRLL